MEQKGIIELFEQQIKDRDKLIGILIEEREEEKKVIRKYNILAFIQQCFLVVIILFALFCYFGLDWASSNYNYNENVNKNITEEGVIHE